MDKRKDLATSFWTCRQLSTWDADRQVRELAPQPGELVGRQVSSVL